MASLTARTVFLKLHPSARTFAERREVLRVMERFGEVSMFKSNKYNPRTPTPNTFIVLFASESAAQDLINASPIRYRLISTTPSPSAPPLGHAPHSPATSSTPSPTADPQSPSEPQSSSQDQNAAQEEHPYQLHAYPSTHNHTLYLASPLLNPLHGPFSPVQPRNSYIAASLSHNTPSSIMTPGLLDWETDSRFSRMALDEYLASPSSGSASGLEGDVDNEGEGREGGGEGEGSTRNAGFYHGRREKRRAERRVPDVMGGLRRLREEFERRERERALEGEWERGGGFAKVDVK
ncbi:hypothetical protein N431DRAFT_402495 [Stipitochalara longipes BDJ]|nr:hypothetical protein N431DRAFT_402495 [Stipitochalara longipes BDJ]